MSQKSEIWTQYVKLENIGSGTFGKLFKAKNIKSGNYYVIKEIDKLKYKSLTNNNFDENSNKQLNLVNKIKIKEKIDSNDFLYIIMELCPFNLEEYLKIRENYLSIDEIRELLIQLNNIFQKFNESNLILRDIKPSNILFSFDNISKFTLKISEYDLSQFLIENKNLNISLTMSPEVLKGENITNKNNIWILGNIIYYMVFKEYLYNAKNSTQLINAINKGKKPKSTPDKELTDLISKMLVVDVNKRIYSKKILEHPFIKKNNKKINNKLINNDTLITLKSFAHKNALQKEIFYFLAKIKNEEEISNLKQLFNDLDTGNSGRLTINEIRNGFKKLGIEINENELEEIWEGLNFHNDDQINYTEFLAAMMSSYKFNKEENLWVVFNYFKDNDNKKNEYISIDNLINMCKSMNLPINEEEIKKNLIGFNKNKLNFEDFKKIMGIVNEDE